MLTIGVISRETASRWSALGATLLVCAVLSGCGAHPARDQSGDTTGTSSAAGTPEPIQSDPILLFVGSASDNEQGLLLDSTTGDKLQVSVGRSYNAASGRMCRPYRILNLSGSSPLTSDLACKDHSGRWKKIRPLLNLDNTRISTTPQ